MLKLTFQGVRRYTNLRKMTRKKFLHLRLFIIAAIGLAGFFMLSAKPALAANPTTINFQGKVVNSDGTNVTDGTYSFVFRIYNTSSPTPASACSGDASCLFEETQGSVTVTSGTFQVELGSTCTGGLVASNSCTKSAAGGLNFGGNSGLYLTLQFNGDTSGSHGGFMWPVIHLTSVPYAYYADNAGSLGGVASSNFVQLATGSLQADTSTNDSIAINKTGVSGDILLLEANNKKALEVDNSGTVLLGQAGASGLNGTLTFNNGSGSHTVSLALQADPGSSYTLLLPTTGPSTSQCLQTDASTANQLVFSSCAGGGGGPTSVVYSTTPTANGGSISGSVLTLTKADGSNPGLLSADAQTIGGDKTLSGTTIFTGTAAVQKTSTSALQVQTNSGASTLLNADTSNMRLGVDVTYAAMSTPTGLTVGAATSGGALTASAVYGYKVAAIDSAGGETTATAEVSGTVGASGTQTLPVSWTAVTGASGYKVYRTAANGAANSEVYLTTVIKTSFTDSGSITPGSATPPASTTAYVSANNSSSSLQQSIGGLGTPTGQVYVSGILPKDVTAGGVATASGPSSVYVLGRYVYIVSQTANKLQIFDVSNPYAPVDVSNGGVSTGSSPRSVYVLGKYAYVADYSASKLQVFDISNPSSPVDISSGGATTGTNPLFVYVQGRYAYVADYTGHKLQVFDISNPAAPADVSSGGIDVGDSANGLYVSGKYAYVSVYELSQVKIYDISNPSSLVLASTISGLGNSGADSLYVTGHYLYLNEGVSGGFEEIFDVNNPSSPTKVNNSSFSASSIFVVGRYAYAATSSTNKFYVYDVSNPAGSFDVSGGGVSTGQGPSSLFVSGRYAYVIDKTDSKLQAFDLGGLYTQQLEAGSAEIGNLSVTSNASFAGDSTISGGLQVGQTLQVANSFSVYGNSYIQGPIVLGGGRNSGTPTSLAASTATAGGSLNGIYKYEVTSYDSNGDESSVSNEVTTANLSLQKQPLTWSAPTTAPAGYKIYRTAASGGSGTEKFLAYSATSSYTDSGQFSANGAAPPAVDTTGQLTVLGSALLKNSTNSAAALQVQNASGAALFNVDTSTTTITFGNSTNGLVLTASTFEPVLNGTARHTKTVTLAPEYPGAVMTGDGTSNTGTMTSDFCSNVGSLVLDSADCATSGDTHSFYSWTSTGANDYDIYIRYRMPSDFSAFSASNPITMYGWRTDSTATTEVDLSLYQANGTQCGTTTNVATGTAVWTSTAMSGTVTSCSISANDLVTFKVHVVVAASKVVKAGELSIGYLSKW